LQPLFSGGHLAGTLLAGGRPGAPIEQSWTSPFGWWHGPQTSLAWPLTGTLSWDAAGYDPVQWDLYGNHLTGTWVTPPDESVQVVPRVPRNQAEGVPLNWSIDAAEPPAEEPASTLGNANPGLAQPLGWSSSSPIAPTATFTVRGSLAAWQNSLVFAGVGIGIGGSMLASIAFELLGPRRARAESDRENTTARQARPETDASGQETTGASPQGNPGAKTGTDTG
jgi:hypothetical protein